MAQNLDALRLALQHSPDNAPLLMLYADGCLDEGLVEDAEQHFHRVLQNEPAHADARLGLGRVALLQGKTSQAAVRAEQILSDTPTCAAAFILLARIHLTENDRPKAKAMYDKGIGMNRSLADPGIEKDLHGVRPAEDDDTGRKRAAMTSSGSFIESVNADSSDDDDGHPRGGAAFDLGLADFALNLLITHHPTPPRAL